MRCHFSSNIKNRCDFNKQKGSDGMIGTKKRRRDSQEVIRAERGDSGEAYPAFFSNMCLMLSLEV